MKKLIHLINENFSEIYFVFCDSFHDPFISNGLNIKGQFQEDFLFTYWLDGDCNYFGEGYKQTIG